MFKLLVIPDPNLEHAQALANATAPACHSSQYIWNTGVTALILLSSMLATLFRSAALVLILLSLAKANYYIDDSNSTITYSERWGNDMSGYDVMKIYNKTGYV